MFIDEETLIFDQENCQNCRDEALAWDYEDFEEKVKKIYGRNYKSSDELKYSYSKSLEQWIAHPNERLCKNPRKKKLRQWRQCDRYRYAKEIKYERKGWQKKFKQKMKQGIMKEEYYNPVKHDYCTYGWLSW